MRNLKPIILTIVLICIQILITRSQVISGDDTVCTGELLTYTAPSGGSGYSWSLIPAVNGAIVVSSSNNASVQWTNAGVELLKVSYTNSGGSPVTLNMTINIFDNPNPLINYDFAVACVDSAHDAGGNPQGGDKDRSLCIKVCDSSITEFYTPANSGSTYKWRAQNGSIIGSNSNSNVFVLWDQLGKGYVRVIETNQYGCTDSTELCVEVIEGPDALFTKPKTSLCLEELICFDNLSTGAVNYIWDFGDGGLSFDFEPCHKYTSPGTYTITLVAINECWCTDTFSCDIVVDSSKGPEVECISTVCAGDCVTYSTPELCSIYNWYVPSGEGTIISGLGTNTIEVCWGAGPVGHICLEVLSCTSGTLCPDTVCYTVPIIPATLNIAGPALVCANSEHNYNIPCFPGSKVDWTVTGGTILEGDSTSEILVQWGSGPTGTINVTIINELTGCSSTGALNVDIKPEFFLFPDVLDVCPGDNTVFFTLTSGTFDWTVTDASNTIVNQVLSVAGGTFSETWTYGSGTYYVTAQPSNSNDFCISSLTATINVIHVPPVDTIIGDTIVCPDQFYSYTALVPTPGTHLVWTATNGTISDPNSNPVVVSWNLNSGPYMLSAVQVLNAYPSCTSAVYSIQVDSLSNVPLNITGSGACVNSSSSFSVGAITGALLYTWSISPPSMGSITSGQGSTSISVEWNNNSGPAVINCSAKVCNHNATGSLGVTVNTATALSMPDNWYCKNSTGTLTVSPSGLSYSWSPSPATGQTTATATGLTQGTYTVTVTNTNGCNSVTAAFLQEIPSPVATITTPDPLAYCIPSPVNTTLYATDGIGYTFNWSGGSSPSSNINNVTSPGIYNLTVIGPGPYFCQAFKSITVSQDSCLPDTGTPCMPVPNSVINFNPSPTSFCNDWNFTNLSNGTNYSWNFGDPYSNVNSGTLPHASHTYTEAGYYTVTLTGDFLNSNPPPTYCKLSTSRVIQVAAVADFEVLTGCIGSNTTFNDLSTFLPSTSISSWSWSFPGGVPSSSTSPGPVNVVYNSSGAYSATLTITHSSGCQSVKTINFNIDPLPNAAFTYAPSPVCLGDVVLFTHTFPSGIIDWNWTFPTATSAAQNPQYNFLTAGLHSVSLTVTNANGCMHTTNANIFVDTPNVGSIMPNKDLVDTCEGDSIKLTAPAGNAWSWSSGESSQIIYAKTTGLYSVTVTDFNGCSYTPDPVFVIIHAKPKAIIEGPNEVCEFDLFTLTAPVGGATYSWIKIGTGIVGSGIAYSPPYLSPGTHQYQVQVTDINGCTSTSPVHSIIVNPAPFVFINYPPPVCEFDPVILTTSASGGTPSYMYNWSTGATGSSTTVYLEGFYGVTLTDSKGCTSESTTAVDLFPLPDFCLVPKGCFESCLPDTICGPVPPLPGYYASYEWLLLDVNCDPIAVVSTNKNFIINAPGKYALVITTNSVPACTDTSDPFDVVELICNDSCYASYDTAFKKILNNITLSSTTVFSGKYFVDDGVIITVNNGATLDLTNVDMVFGNCAGIDFLDGATVRANNSVFRPCNLSESWRGFEFRTGSGGIIDECVFKNAQRALIFWSSNTVPTDARIMNNFFYNCKMNVVSVYGAFREPVTGNTFIVESLNIDYDKPSCPVYIPYSSEHWGIIGYYSDFIANVSQNDFIHAGDVDNTKKFIGVYLVRGSGIFSENKFTNMYRSFDLHSARNSSIENNEIEITQQFTTVQNQIRGSLCTNMWVLSNEIEDTYEYRTFYFNSSAIYFSGGSGLQIKENRIEGFSNGIILLNSNGGDIIENQIFNSNQYGIYLSNAQNIDVSCNIINMDDVLSTVSTEVGIAHFQSTTANLNNIYRNNCILETDIAMYFSTPPPIANPAQLPRIVNNFLYSYNSYGVQVFNFDGNIGSAAGSFSTGGRNTFVSNNVPNGAVDIFSNSFPLDEAGNFGINLLVNVNSLGARNAYHSTASCANQIEYDLGGITPNPNQELTQEERCDPFILDLPPARLYYGEDVLLNENFMEVILTMDEAEQFSIVIELVRILSGNATTAELDKLKDFIEKQKVLSINDRKWFDYYYALYLADYSQAEVVLKSINAVDPDEADLLVIESAMIDMIVTGEDFVLLSPGLKDKLKAIDDSRMKFASLARDLLQLAEGEHNYIFAELENVETVKNENSEMLLLNPDLLEVFPNPVRDKINIKYYVKDPENANFSLYDLNGLLISDLKWKYAAAKLTVDLNDLSSGVYLFVIRESNGSVKRAKIVKQ